MTKNLTAKQYSALQAAYDVFNAELFGGDVPQCLITFQHGKKFRGYFWADKFHGRHQTGVVHEIALNPDAFADRTDVQILSTLAHEMAHCWQQVHGTPSRSAYHNSEWAAKMVEIGLMPSNTGEVGGKKTGQNMTHYVIDGGPFDVSARKFIAGGGFSVDWQCMMQTPAKAATAKTKAASKTKYCCPDCGANAWAKPGANLVCGDCEQQMLAEGEVETDSDVGAA